MSGQVQVTNTTITGYQARRAVSPRLLRVLLAALAILLPASMVAYLVVHGYWHIAVALILAVPALLVLQRWAPHFYPTLSTGRTLVTFRQVCTHAL